MRVIFLLISLVLYGCDNKSNKQLIIGTWDYSTDSSTDPRVMSEDDYWYIVYTVDGKIESFYKETINGVINEIHSQSDYHLSDDGKFIVESLIIDERNGEQLESQIKTRETEIIKLTKNELHTNLTMINGLSTSSMGTFIFKRRN